LWSFVVVVEGNKTLLNAILPPQDAYTYYIAKLRPLFNTFYMQFFSDGTRWNGVPARF
jgi:hypothetical protein